MAASLASSWFAEQLFLPAPAFVIAEACSRLKLNYSHCCRCVSYRTLGHLYIVLKSALKMMRRTMITFTLSPEVFLIENHPAAADSCDARHTKPRFV
jgi:hypothetical protein